VDLDGDGIKDIISGSYPGELYFFRGLGPGKFADGVKIKDKDGKDIKVGYASTVFAADWFGRGKLDLLVGHIDGSVYLIPNEGTAKQYAFGKPQKLQADGKDIRVAHGDSHPVAADWDRDGKLDLVVGTGAGGVVWYRNIGTRTEPKLAAAQTLVAESPLTKNWNASLKEGQWGTRAKVCVVDWNGDGWPDLLVGDFSMNYGPEPKLSDADKAAQAEANKKLAPLQREFQQVYQKYAQLLKPPPQETPEAKKEREKQLKVLQEKVNKMSQEMSRHYAVLRKFQRPYSYHGNVWLFLRKPPPEVKASR
jgi:hypothetical protein